MKRLPFIFCLFFILSTFLQAQDDLENEYAYGTITTLTDKEILLKEYNYEKEEFVEISYQILPETKVRNTDSIKSIASGNQVEILYQDVDGKKNALVVVLENEEGVVEVDNPEKTDTGSTTSAAIPSATSASGTQTVAPTTEITTQITPQTTSATAPPSDSAQGVTEKVQTSPVTETAPSGETASTSTPEQTPEPASASPATN